MSKSVYYYKPLPKDDTAIEKALQQKAKEHSEEGFWKAYDRLRKKESHGTINGYIGSMYHLGFL